MTDPPLIPGALYGLRTWRVGSDDEGEYLTGAWQRARWPADGVWLNATCARGAGHPAPQASCACGVHAWHPRRRSARRLLASRFEVPGIVEAAGAVELQDDGFRAQRARPYAFVVAPGRNARMAARLARRYHAEVVHVRNAQALLAWCHERGLGLSEDTVAQLLGPERAAERIGASRRKRRRDVLGIAAAVTIAAASLGLGVRFETGPPSSHGVFGRTGWVKRPTCPRPVPHAVGAARAGAGGGGAAPQRAAAGGC